MAKPKKAKRPPEPVRKLVDINEYVYVPGSWERRWQVIYTTTLWSHRATIEDCRLGASLAGDLHDDRSGRGDVGAPDA